MLFLKNDVYKLADFQNIMAEVEFPSESSYANSILQIYRAGYDMGELRLYCCFWNVMSISEIMLRYQLYWGLYEKSARYF